MENNIDFYDIYDFYYTPFWETAWFKLIIIVFALALIGIGIYLFIKRKKRALAPWEIALQELEKLSLDNCRSSDEYKKFYFGLSHIFKSYLNKRFAWNTEDKTDDELISWLEQQNLAPEMLEMLKKMSSGALWIKYANVTALKSQAQEDLKTVTLIIEHTKQPQTTNNKHS